MYANTSFNQAVEHVVEYEQTLEIEKLATEKKSTKRKGETLDSIESDDEVNNKINQSIKKSRRIY